MFVLVAAPSACKQALEQTLESLSRAGLSQVQVRVADGDGGGLRRSLNRTLQEIGDGWILLLWAGERLAQVISEPAGPEACWLPVCDAGGEPHLELRLVRNQPGLRFSGGTYPFISHPARNAPWAGSALGAFSILRDPPLPALPLPATRRAKPAELLEAARRRLGHKQFRRAAALAGAASRRLAPAEYLAWEAAMVEARAWEAAGEFGRAVAALQRILPHHPEATETRFRLGYYMGRLERWAEAAGCLQACLDQGEGPWYYNPSPAVAGWRAHWALAAAREALGDLRGAADLYGQAFAGNPALWEAPYRLAACLSRMGKARAIRQRLVSLLDDSNPEHGMLLADVLSVQGRYSEALQAVAAVERSLGVTQETASFRGYALFMLGRFEAARIAFERLAPSASLYGGALLWRLHAAWAGDDWPEATRCLRKLAKAPVAPVLRRLYGHLHRLLVDGGGFTQLSRGRAESLVIGKALLTLLHAFWTAGRPDLGRRLLLLLPLLNWPHGYREAGLLAFRCGLGAAGRTSGRGRIPGQRSLLEEADRLLARVDPPDADLCLGRARIALELGRPHEACALLQRESHLTWEGFRVWAQALMRLGSRIAPRSRKERRS